VPEAKAIEELVVELRHELRRVAASAMRRERSDHTLQPTALVNEVYLRLAQSPGLVIRDRKQFLAVAARSMRQVLVDYARARARSKRGAGALRVTLHDGIEMITPGIDMLILAESLERLRKLSDEQAQIVELRYFAGLSVQEVAEVLDVSPTTVKRDSAMAKAWLLRELRAGDAAAT
jgi:RNA polymerase sigma factor (TIGR02999 family)